MSKFDMRICKCGKIHFIDNKLIENALEQDKNIMFVCGSCGSVQLVGADRYLDYSVPKKTIFNMYTINVQEEQLLWDESIFTGADGKKAIDKVLYSKGIPVMMQSGYFATSFDHGTGKFQDMWYPDFYKVPVNATAQEYKEFIEKWQKDSATVNMPFLLRTLTDEQADCLSGYIIEGFDWSDTKYAYKYK